MELLDRYLQAVRFWLPKGQQEDILAELSEDIRSQIDDEQARLGRELSEAELEALLKGRGHPMTVAEPYLPRQHLIGPVALPAYWSAMKITLSAMAAIFLGCWVVFGIILRDAASDPALARPGFWLWNLCVYGLAYVGLLTLIFALAERSRARARAAESWDPRHPRALPRPPADAEARHRQRMRASAVGEVAGCLVFILWWLGALRLPSLAEVQMALAPVWQSLWWPILALEVVWLALAGAILVRPRRTPLYSGLSLARDAFGLVLIGLLLRAEVLVEVSVPSLPAQGVSEISRWIHVSVAITLAVIAVSLAARAIQDARALLGKKPLHSWVLSLLGAD